MVPCTPSCHEFFLCWTSFLVKRKVIKIVEDIDNNVVITNRVILDPLN